MESYFIQLISSAIFKTKIEALPAENVDFVALAKLAKNHSVSAILYTRLKELYSAKELQNISAKEDNNIFSVVQRAAMQEQACQEICDQLKSQNIKFVKLKGMVLRDLYPIKEFRTMGDIDILIEEKSKKLVNTIMLKNGYICIGYQHGSYKNGQIYVELHTSMNDEKRDSKIVSNLWDYCNSDDGIEYILQPYMHLFFTIYHAVKHIRGYGCGVRMLLDIAILTNALGDSLDWQKLKENLVETKILKTSAFLYALCERWFGIKNKLDFACDANVLQKFSKFVIVGGTFGFSNPDGNSTTIATSYAKDYKGHSKFVVTLKYLFPSLAIMKINYPALKKCAILLPFCWIARIFKFIFRRKKSKAIFKEIANVDAAKEFYESIGIIGQDL